MTKNMSFRIAWAKIYIHTLILTMTLVETLFHWYIRARTASSLTTVGSVKKNASGETFLEMIVLAQISSIRK